MACEWCYDTEGSLHDCRAWNQAMQEEMADESEGERMRAIVVLSSRLLLPATWSGIWEEVRDMGGVTSPDDWYWIWLRLLAVRAVVCLVFNWRRGPDWSSSHWIEDLWVDGRYWYWVEVGDGWLDWWAWVSRDCPDTSY